LDNCAQQELCHEMSSLSSVDLGGE
jgi:hypothetical protein